MHKRKTNASSDLPRKRAKSNQPIEIPSLQTFNTSTASSSSLSPSSSSSSSTPPRHAKRKRPESLIINGQDESDTSISTKRARTQSPRQQSLDPDLEDWPLHDDHPETQAHIYWEPTDLTERARQWRARATLAMQGMRSCSCGKMHQAIGRKSWHYPGQEPELEDPDESYSQLEPLSVYQSPSRSRARMPSPGLSDEGSDADDSQLNFAPINASIPREPLTAPDSQVPDITEAPNVSPDISTTTPTPNIVRASRQRKNTLQSVEKSNPPHKTRKKYKSKK
ncbi:hypothetical protein V8C35DRAFT_318816 [Trichoderma chlorosporum]